MFLCVSLQPCQLRRAFSSGLRESCFNKTFHQPVLPLFLHIVGFRDVINCEAVSKHDPRINFPMLDHITDLFPVCIMAYQSHLHKAIWNSSLNRLTFLNRTLAAADQGNAKLHEGSDIEMIRNCNFSTSATRSNVGDKNKNKNYSQPT